MTTEEFMKFVSVFKTAFPKDNLLPNKESLEYWYRLLKDIEYDKVMAFIGKWSCTEKWPPTIAEIRAGCAEFSEEKFPDWGEGWDETCKAIRTYGYMQPDKGLASLSPITRQVVSRLGFENLCKSENPMADRSQFRNLFEIISKREIQDRQIPEAIKQQISSFLPSSNQKLLQEETMQ